MNTPKGGFFPKEKIVYLLAKENRQHSLFERKCPYSIDRNKFFLYLSYLEKKS